MTAQHPTAYETARDEYGRLNKYQREEVLNLVSSYTDKTSGDEAEAAFVKAVTLVRAGGNCGGYLGGIYYY